MHRHPNANTNHTTPTGPGRSAVLDTAHEGDIRGAFGTIAQGNTGRRTSLRARLRTLVAIVGPGLIVMVGDNDAGAFGTYTQAGQNYGTSLLWTLLVLVPVLYVNQEMVVRLGAVTGVGHARLILERFGRFWGAFSVLDLFLLNALTLMTEFIGISMGTTYLGLPTVPGVLLSAAIVVATTSTGSFRTFERLCLVLVAGSLLLVPIAVLAHPPTGQLAHDFLVPNLPGAGDQLATVLLLITSIVGTTVAPWQLFFQQSYLIDKRITPRFLRYEKVDLWLGLAIVVAGAGAMMALSAAAFGGRPEFGQFTDAAGVADGLARYVSPALGALFAVALIDASIIGAAAVSLSSAYALADVTGLKHSLHRGPNQARGFYAVLAGLLGVSALVVVLPGSPLGLITEGVQVLAGVLLPSATVFLLLLCNDRAVLGPWVNGPVRNLVTAAVIAVLVMLSITLTASVLFDIDSAQILTILIAGSALSLLLGAGWLLSRRRAHQDTAGEAEPGTDRELWRTPPLEQLPAPRMSRGRRFGLGLLRTYILVALGMVVVQLTTLALRT